MLQLLAIADIRPKPLYFKADIGHRPISSITFGLRTRSYDRRRVVAANVD